MSDPAHVRNHPSPETFASLTMTSVFALKLTLNRLRKCPSEMI